MWITGRSVLVLGQPGAPDVVGPSSGEASSSASPANTARLPRRRSTTRAMTSDTMNSTVIGNASISIENGSVDGVATAANTNVPTTIHGR